MAFEFLAQKLIYGGAALGHHQGHPVLVPLTLPGERLEVEPVRRAKGMVHARPLRLLSAAADRTEPPCPYFGRCGGCQYQHLDAERQTAAKREILRETLRRIGKTAWEADIPGYAAGPWNYRNQVQFKITQDSHGGPLVGFFEAESHRLVPVDACLIISPRLNAVLRELRSPPWSHLLSGCREIEMLADERDEEVMLTLRGEISSELGESLAQETLARLPGVKCVAVQARPEFRVFGRPALKYKVGDFEYQISPGSFFQASRFLLPEFLGAVTNTDKPWPLPKVDLALDLFAGVGLFTLPLAQRFTQVIGVEAKASAAADLAANAQGLTHVRPVHQSAFDFLRRFAQPLDLVVLDPPRAGVDLPALKLLAALRPARIHYVSCHPPTLARDLALLTERGYGIDSIELFDFFPQTYHIESLVRLTPRSRLAERLEASHVRQQTLMTQSSPSRF